MLAARTQMAQMMKHLAMLGFDVLTPAFSTVMPRSFYFMPSHDIDMWMPASFPPGLRGNFTWHDAQIVARLKPGVTLEQARQSMAALSLQVTAKDFRGPHSVTMIPLREGMAGNTGPASIVLLWASAGVLLIARVNLANLLVARGEAARRGGPE